MPGQDSYTARKTKFASRMAGRRVASNVAVRDDFPATCLVVLRDPLADPSAGLVYAFLPKVVTGLRIVDQGPAEQAAPFDALRACLLFANYSAP